MGNKIVTNKINFDDINYAIKRNDNYIIINVLDANEQQCLIYKTLPYDKEETIINDLLIHKKDCNIIIYGKNCNDNKIIKKYNDLMNLGFYNVYIYLGGMFEWLMLQDIYGVDMFQTTNSCNNILLFKPNSTFT